MSIDLIKATRKDLTMILENQKAAFNDLLLKYKDIETNPALDTVEKLNKRLSNSETYIIVKNDLNIGALSIEKNSQGVIRLNRLFIIPSFQGKGIAQEVIKKVELMYDAEPAWELTTIKEEEKLRYLYEKMGYKVTGFEKELKDGMTLIQYRKDRGKEINHD